MLAPAREREAQGWCTVRLVCRRHSGRVHTTQDVIVPGNWFLCALHDRRRERENLRLVPPLVSCGLLEVHTDYDASAIAACL